MGELSAEERLVAHHYDANIFDFEVSRLASYPVEFAMTIRYLDRYIADGSLVAEVGVGGGAYTEHLARRGCRLHLADVSDRLLVASLDRLRAAGVEHQVLSSRWASAADLGHLEDGLCGAVLLLGPLYHLRAAEERRRAVHEAWRIAAPGGVVFAAGINRLGYLRDLLRNSPREILARRSFHAQFLCDGNLDPSHAPPLGFAHLTTLSEMRALLGDGFQEVALVGVESFANLCQKDFLGLSDEEQSAWLELIEQTGSTPEGLGASDHFLYVGRKREPL